MLIISNGARYLFIASLAVSCGGRIQDDLATSSVGGSSSRVDSRSAAVDAGDGAAVSPAAVCVDCCVPMQLSASDLNLYQVSQGLSVAVTIERAPSMDTWSPWLVAVIVATPWGESQCETGIVRGFAGVTMQCADIDAPSATCGSTVEVQVRARSTRFLDTNVGSGCTDDAQADLGTYALPIECPSCPSADVMLKVDGSKHCSYPSNASCPYGIGKRVGLCYCTLSPRVWLCEEGN